MSIIEVIAALGITTNMAAMGWIMSTLYQLRQEISGTHTRLDLNILHLDKRVTRLEDYIQ